MNDEAYRIPYPPIGATWFWAEWGGFEWYWGNPGHHCGPFPSYAACLADFAKAYPHRGAAKPPAGDPGNGGGGQAEGAPPEAANRNDEAGDMDNRGPPPRRDEEG